MIKIIILNGPNLNLLGEREKNQYGTETLKDIEISCKKFAEKNQINTDFFQSNIEGELVEKIQKFTNDVVKNAKHLIGTELQEQNENFVNATENNVEIKSPKPKFQRQNSRKMSFATTVQVARWGKRAKRSISRQNSVLEEHPTELMVSTVTNEYLHAIVIL